VKDFSIFEYALKFSGIETAENLGEVASISRRDFDERKSFLCLTTTPSVEYACLMVENALLLRTDRAGRVYAGFEKLSGMLPVIDRYLRIADVSESVYVFGQPDWQPPRHPNIRIVDLSPDFRLARESFLIAQAPSLNVAVVAFDEARETTISPDGIRYWVLKTSDANVVRELSTALEDVIDWTIAA
jgi:DICT domain-containing protein